MQFELPKKSVLEVGVLRNGKAAPAVVGSTTLTTVTTVNSESKNTWITCYGFPPGQAEAIIQYFSLKGIQCIDYFPRSKEEQDLNNWIHVRFSSGKDVSIALSIDNKVIDLNGKKLMLGVKLFPEGDQISSGQNIDPLAVNIVAPPSSGGGPKRATSLFERAAVWVMDM